MSIFLSSAYTTSSQSILFLTCSFVGITLHVSATYNISIDTNKPFKYSNMVSKKVVNQYHRLKILLVFGSYAIDISCKQIDYSSYCTITAFKNLIAHFYVWNCLKQFISVFSINFGRLKESFHFGLEHLFCPKLESCVTEKI